MMGIRYNPLSFAELEQFVNERNCKKMLDEAEKRMAEIALTISALQIEMKYQEQKRNDILTIMRMRKYNE